MITFTHVITDYEGLHARPVAQIAAAVHRCESAVTVACGDRVARAGDLLGLMGINARRGETLEFRIEGPDERQAAESLHAVLDGWGSGDAA